MATGGRDHSQSGHEDCVWDTRRVTVSPSEPRSTLRLSGAGAGAIVVDEEISFRGIGYKRGDNSEDVGQFVDESGVVKSPSRNFGCVEGTAEEELVTRPAVHGTTAGMRRGVYFMASRASQMCPPDDGQREQFWDEDVVTATTTGPSLSQSWRAGDVVENVYASGDPYHRFAHGRNVTNGAQRGAMVCIPSGHYTDDFDYPKDIMSQRSGVMFSSCCNENVIQPGQEFLTRSGANVNCFNNQSQSETAGLCGRPISCAATLSYQQQCC